MHGFKLLFVVALVAAAPHAQACGCGDARAWEEVVDSSDVLFAGRFIRARPVYSPDLIPWLELPSWIFPEPRRSDVALLFAADQWWNGAATSYVEVRTDRSSCGLAIPEGGEEMLIEAYEHRGVLFTWLCLRSVPIRTQREIDSLMVAHSEYAGASWLVTRDTLRYHLGPGRSPSDESSNYGVPFAIVAFFLAVGLVWWVAAGAKR